MSSQPVRPTAGVRHSSTGRVPSYENRLSIIDEDSTQTRNPPPRIPPRAVNRPLERMFGITFHRSAHDDMPPPYSVYDDVTGPKGEKFTDVRENKRVPARRRRGGWKRFGIIAAVLVVIIVAVVVGTVVGLRKKSKKPSPPPPSNTTLAFPAGMWTFTTFLSTVSTDCTSNPATWLCFPYTTYNTSSTASQTTFNWIINLTGKSESNYAVSSSDNPFALTFSNATLQLIDRGLETEAYYFSVPMDKVVKPTTALTDDNAATSCEYHETTFDARLYTRMQKTYPTGVEPSSDAASSDQNFVPWPHAVKVEQRIGGGANVPACYKTVNGENGDRVTAGLSDQGEGRMCSCEYLNYGNS